MKYKRLCFLLLWLFCSFLITYRLKLAAFRSDLFCHTSRRRGAPRRTRLPSASPSASSAPRPAAAPLSRPLPHQPDANGQVAREAHVRNPCPQHSSLHFQPLSRLPARPVFARRNVAKAYITIVLPLPVAAINASSATPGAREIISRKSSFIVRAPDDKTFTPSFTPSSTPSFTPSFNASFITTSGCFVDSLTVSFTVTVSFMVSLAFTVAVMGSFNGPFNEPLLDFPALAIAAAIRAALTTLTAAAGPASTGTKAIRQAPAIARANFFIVVSPDLWQNRFCHSTPLPTKRQCSLTSSIDGMLRS